MDVADDTETELETTDVDDHQQAAMAEATTVTRSFRFQVEAIGVSLINSTPQELLYVSFRVTCRNTMKYNCYPEVRSEEHTSELQSLMRISYAVFCLKKK